MVEGARDRAREYDQQGLILVEQQTLRGRPCNHRTVLSALSCGADRDCRGARPSPQPRLRPPTSMALEEVVVTARKRDESFRDVPVAGERVHRAGHRVRRHPAPADFIALVPNMTLVETQNAGNAFVVVRGISQARNSEPSVAVLVDGVLETNPPSSTRSCSTSERSRCSRARRARCTAATPSAARSSSRTKRAGATSSAAWSRCGYDTGPGSTRAQAASSGPVGGPTR